MHGHRMPGQASMFLVALGLLLLVFASFPCNSLAQDAGALPLTFDRLTSEQGLTSERVQAIAQDQQGFIWIGTWNGLFRYDGRTVRAYLHNPDDPNSLGGNIVNSLHVDRGGNLWIGLTDAGIDRYGLAGRIENRVVGVVGVGVVGLSGTVAVFDGEGVEGDGDSDSEAVPALPESADAKAPAMQATVAYIVRAVTPGTYVHPAATVEDMYRPERYARTAAGTLTVGMKE